MYFGGTTAYYDLPVDRSGLSYTLYDAAGAAVYTLVNPPVPAFAFATAIVSNNAPLGDGVFFQQGTDAVAGLTTPAPLGGDLFSDGFVDVEFRSTDLSILSGLGIPTDTATYRRFGGGTFSPSAAWFSSAPDGVSYALVATQVNYRIDSVTVTAVTAPPAVVLALLGGLLAAARAGRRPHLGGPRPQMATS